MADACNTGASYHVHKFSPMNVLEFARYLFRKPNEREAANAVLADTCCLRYYFGKRELAQLAKMIKQAAPRLLN